MCRSGFPNVCLTPFPSLGYKVNGGFEELFAVPENIFRLGFVNPIPRGLSFEHASLSEIIACCLNAQRSAEVRKGDTVLVLGSGPAGLQAAVGLEVLRLELRPEGLEARPEEARRAPEGA